MASDDHTIFHDGGNLQNAIALAVQERKALLCFIHDDSEEGTSWEISLLDLRLRRKLTQTTVVLKLKAGSEQAGFLNAVVQINSVPAVVIIQNAQVVANYQRDTTTFEAYQLALQARFELSDAEADAEAGHITQNSQSRRHIELPSSEGRMRLPNNAYDHLRKLTTQYLAAGVTGWTLLHNQLMLLESLNIDLVSSEVKAIQDQFESISEPGLSEQSQNLLLNTPASRFSGAPIPVESPPASFRTNPAPAQPSAQEQRNSSTTHRQTQSRQPDSSSDRAQSSNPTSPPPSSAPPPVQAQSSQQQRQIYIRAQQSREAYQRAERDRIKSQIAADRQARRDAEQARKAADRKVELDRLRTANSTTTAPKSTDIRVQVRTFDGTTIRNTFPHTATINASLRPWIESSKNPSTGHPVTEGKPYDLKIILTPSPNRTIEASEEELALSEVEGVAGAGSCTFVMVLVKGFVDSYTQGSGGAAGMLGTVVGGGYGLVSGAMGMVTGGLGRLFGGGTPVQGQAGAVQNEAQAESSRVGGGGGTGANVRVRTLADQRAEVTDRRKKDHQLYNGNQLNFEPRKDTDENGGGTSNT